MNTCYLLANAKSRKNLQCCQCLIDMFFRPKLVVVDLLDLSICRDNESLAALKKAKEIFWDVQGLPNTAVLVGKQIEWEILFLLPFLLELYAVTADSKDFRTF